MHFKSCSELRSSSAHINERKSNQISAFIQGSILLVSIGILSIKSLTLSDYSYSLRDGSLLMAGVGPEEKKVGSIKKFLCVGLGKRKIYKGKGWVTIF